MNRLLFIILVLAGLACTETETDPVTTNNDMPENNKSDDTVINGTFTYLALGDSYTIGQSVAESERFPVQLVNKLNNNGVNVSKAEIVATTGWTTDELANGIKNTSLNESYDMVSLLIGVNNQYRGRDTAEYRTQFVDLLRTAIKFGNSNPDQVIVISIPDWGVTPFAEFRDTDKIAKEIDTFNQINRDETSNLGARYVDITSISRMAKNDPKLVANDGLHPSGEMYRLWVEEIYKVAKEILKNQ